MVFGKRVESDDLNVSRILSRKRYWEFAYHARMDKNSWKYEAGFGYAPVFDDSECVFMTGRYVR